MIRHMEILKIYQEEQLVILCDKAFNISKNPKLMEIKKVMLQWFTNTTTSIRGNT